MALAPHDRQPMHHTASSYKRARAAVVVPELPESVTWLEHTTLEMTATASKSLTHCSTEYVLHVHHRPTPDSKPVSWQVSRSFDDYVRLQKRLLKTLAYGHACSAECRWLHSFAKKYFPKKALFGNCSTTTMNHRREKLIRFMNVLKSSLLNRGNHGCFIVVNSLANEFTSFLEGNDHHHSVSISVLEQEESERVRRCSMSSSISTSSTDAGDEHDDEHHHHHILGELDDVCDLCHCHLDGVTSSTDDSTDDSSLDVDQSPCHTTTLNCGHQFHDGCVLPQLEALNFCCPSCSEPQL